MIKVSSSNAKTLMLVGVVIGHAMPALAQENDAGKTAYLSSCAACHGAEAKGDGFLNSVLKVPAPDLTTLARRNDGAFPIAAVTEIIDGRLLIAAHGSREMPIWGFDTMVRNRISIIVDYLSRIQIK
jgi:mono/diheme cytochrome c family protein